MSCTVRAEDKKIPPRPNSEELIAAVMALPVEERTYSKIFRLGRGLFRIIVLVRMFFG